MKIIVEVAPEQAEFALEVLRSFAFVKTARPRKASKLAVTNTADQLVSSASAERLKSAGEWLDGGEEMPFSLPVE